jgi:hypothetical protein
MLCSLSQLDDKKLEQIRSLENELGKNLLSFTCHDIKTARLNDEELGKVRDLENTLGVALVATE